MRIALSLAFFFACLLHASAAPAKPLLIFENCSLDDHPEWADGDSFQIKTATGVEHTIRLYGVDCMEWHVNDESDSRRLRAQRRYFGITEAVPKAEKPEEFAKAFGKTAAEKTRDLLQKPFTVYTRLADARGDGKHKRIYAFIKCADGSDLASELVRAGLARAFGVNADGPGEQTAEEFAEALDDLELQAATQKMGIWAKTNWEKLPAERKEQRQDDEEVKLSIDDQKLKDGETINPNTASRDDLIRLPGIGDFLADRIIEAREESPFVKSEDLLRVPKLKQKTLEKVRHYLDFKAP